MVCRRVANLAWEVENAAALIDSNLSCLAAVKHVDSLFYPPLFLGDETFHDDGKPLFENGYCIDDALISPYSCHQLVNEFASMNAVISREMVDSSAMYDIFCTALKRIYLHTGLPHLIWNCIYFAKTPNSDAVSDIWHYDNHYNVWTPKLMIYLNSQAEEFGATHFIDSNLSRHISEKTDYMGMVWQRKNYPDILKGSEYELGLNSKTLDPEYFTFSPREAGSGVWFYPARVLHRGVSPKKGVRHVLSLSLTYCCGWSVDDCIQASICILKIKYIIICIILTSILLGIFGEYL